MDKSSGDPSSPWQALTFSGVARFASASFSRFALAALAVAGISAGAVVYFLFVNWEPIFRKAIRALPADTSLRSSHLVWTGAGPANLAANSFVSILVNTNNSASIDQTSDIQFEFRGDELRIGSLLGYLPCGYPAGWNIGLDRANVEPWWEAWHPVVFLAIWGILVSALLILWGIMATVICSVPRLAAFFLDRPLSWWSAFKLSVAAQWAATIMVAMLVLSYNFGQIPLIRLLSGSALGAVVPLLYAVVSPFRLPKTANPAARNPFQKEVSESDSPKKTSAAQTAEEP